MQTYQLPPTKKQSSLLASSPTILGAGRDDDQTRLIAGAVLPAQFFGRPQDAAQKRGLWALMLAMLTDALECYQQQFLPGSRDLCLAKEAEAWLFSNDEKWPFAFVNVCTILGIEPEYIRRGLRRVRRASPATARQKLRYTPAVRRVSRITA